MPDKWDYRVAVWNTTETPADFERELNELGEDGFELVCSHRIGHDGFETAALLKRKRS